MLRLTTLLIALTMTTSAFAYESYQQLWQRQLNQDRQQFQQQQLWQSTLPLGRDVAARGRKYATRNVGDTVPLLGSACGSPTGVPFCFSDPGRELQRWNPWDRAHPNGMMTVTGQSGSGRQSSQPVGNGHREGTRALEDQTGDPTGGCRLHQMNAAGRQFEGCDVAADRDGSRECHGCHREQPLLLDVKIQGGFVPRIAVLVVLQPLEEVVGPFSANDLVIQ